MSMECRKGGAWKETHEYIHNGDMSIHENKPNLLLSMVDKNLAPSISVIIPVYNATSTLEDCLKGVASSDYPEFEIIVVDDGSSDGSQQVAKFYTDMVSESSAGVPKGPAHARNRGAEIAKGDILFFVDADVTIQPNALSEIAQTFLQHPEYIATFGSYDENPSHGEFLSQYKNLFHHFVHQQAHQDAGTFWSGCGAIYKRVFLELGGFDEVRYPRPSIEDIELGYRLRAAGYKIFVNKNIQGKHLKRWTLTGLLKSDILDRGIPWTQLIMQERNLPNDLNLSFSQRISAVLLGILLLYLSWTAVFQNIALLPLLVILFMLVVAGWQFYGGMRILQLSWQGEVLAFLLIILIGVLAWRENLPAISFIMGTLLAMVGLARSLPNPALGFRKMLFAGVNLALLFTILLSLTSYPAWIYAPVLSILAIIILLNKRFYLFFAVKRGIIFSLAIFPFHMLYYLYSMLSFALGGGMHLWKTSLNTRQASE